MRRLLLMVTCLCGALFALAPAVHFASAAAPKDPMAGTRIEVLSSGTPAATSGRALMLLRVTMDPGTVIPAHHHPGPVSLFVEQGKFGTQFFAGTGQVTRAATSGGTPTPAITLKTGNNITMAPGDHLFYDGVVHTMRNDGKGELVLLIAALFDPNQPGFIWMGMGTGTPAAYMPGADRPSTR